MIAHLYYTLRPLIPRWTQILLRRQRVSRQYRHLQNGWPIWEEAGAPPPHWPGWPGGKRFALVLTHDVETKNSLGHCTQLAELEMARGFRSAFAFVPRRYHTPDQLRQWLTERGFEILVHGLIHDGKLYRSRRIFTQRAIKINEYFKRWGARGFASPAAHHHLQWIADLDIEYDISTYDNDPFEPQVCGIGRIFPYWVQAPGGRGYVELPYTLAQDFTLFILLREQTNGLWRKKLDWIAQHGGMALIKTHADYMQFPGEPRKMDCYPVERYLDFLDYVRSRYGDDIWIAKPAEVAEYWRQVSASIDSDSTPLASLETFCASCRRAHAAGWLHHYRPAPAGKARENVACSPPDTNRREGNEAPS
jgi:hypothetical protein